MKTATKKTAALSASVLMAMGGIGTTFLASAPADAQEPQGNDPQIDENITSEDSGIVSVRVVEGRFAFSQGVVSPNAHIARVIGEASKYLCGGQSVVTSEDVAAQDWEISIGGAVNYPETMSVTEFADSGFARSLVMGCSCSGNPVDGTASVDAEVTGMPLSDIINMVEPVQEANTVVFASADGYEIALPLSYVSQHYSSVVFAVNGAELAESVGGTNQLWLGSTPASYFARDIVAIDFQVRQTPPPSPTSEEGRAQLQNLPNIGVVYGGDVR